MTFDKGLSRRSPDLLDTFERDIDLIRQDLIAVLQETADVRATMMEFSSWRPSVTKRFIVVGGLLCFLAVAVLVIYQKEFQFLVHRFWLMFS